MVDVIVVGGGLIGMLTARELQQRGASVRVLERGRMGGESSWAGGGILSPLYPWRYSDAVNLLAEFGHQHYPAIAQALHDESGIDPEYTQSGMLVLDQQENSQALAWSKRWRMRLDCLDAHALGAMQTGIQVQNAAALWLPDIAQLRNPRLVKAALGSLCKRGILCEVNSTVSGLEIDRGVIRGVRTDQQLYRADKVVVAGGAWSSNIIGGCATPPKIRPSRRGIR